MREKLNPNNSGEAVDAPSKLANCSRLEMRWSTMFTAMDWDNRYRPWKVDGFAPSFILDFPHDPIAVFVADALTTKELLTIGRAAARAKCWEGEILVLGSNLPSYDESQGPCSFAIGQLGEVEGRKVSEPQWGFANVFRCRGCKGIGMCHGLLSYHCRLCGVWEGDHHLGPLGDEIPTFWKVSGDLADKLRP